MLTNGNIWIILYGEGDDRVSKDYGFYGKGIEGYVQYMQAFEDSKKGSSGGGGNHQNGNNTGCAAVLTILIIIAVICIIKAILD